MLEATNIEGRKVNGDQWIKLYYVTFEIYIIIQIMADEKMTRGESTNSLWNLKIGRLIFSASMSQNHFRMYYIFMKSHLDMWEDKMTHLKLY